MKLIMKRSGTIINIKDDSREFKFDLNETVNFNEFIKHISDYESKIEYNDDDLNYTEPDITQEILKFIDYTLKILVAFNDSFDEVYDDDPFAI
ncbi:MAG: hypothetical protein GY714_08575 [Desulfobacterales bacterium]|nr:hypothetical protein [Desulfobacterales bacterium]